MTEITWNTITDANERKEEQELANEFLGTISNSMRNYYDQAVAVCAFAYYSDSNSPRGQIANDLCDQMWEYSKINYPSGLWNSLSVYKEDNSPRDENDAETQREILSSFITNYKNSSDTACNVLQKLGLSSEDFGMMHHADDKRASVYKEKPIRFKSQEISNVI